MKLELRSFTTKLGRRIFTLFVLCALLPITALAFLSFIHVRGEITDQTQKRLHQENKAIGISIYDRLLLITSEMRALAALISTPNEPTVPALQGAFLQRLHQRFSSLTVIRGTTDHVSLLGDFGDPPELSEAEMAHLDSGKALIQQTSNPGSSPAFFLFLSLKSKTPDRCMLRGKIKKSFIWGPAEGRPPYTQLCALDCSIHRLFSTFPGAPSFCEPIRKEISDSHTGQFQWQHGNDAYFANYRSIFLKPNFHYPKLIIVLSESKSHAYGAMIDFGRLFLVIVILSFGMVVLLSVSQIRKSLDPIGTLRDATRKIAQGAFGHQVKIKSGDEFETLGHSFNEMSLRLSEGQALLVRAAKLSTMGQMGAGIIHEIKQPLTAILLNLQILLDGEHSETKRARLEKLLGSFERLNDILSKFRTFSYMTDEKMEAVAISEVLEQTYELFEHQLSMNDVQYQMESEEGLPPIYGDSNGLQQVFSNLLINSLDALRSAKDRARTITVKAYSDHNMIYVDFEDNGSGIPKGTLEKIFDPFYTTKGPEKGTGLGLAIVEAILHRHHASISVESQVDIGTKFTMAFPIQKDDEALPDTLPVG